jgi:APA family basic amino acid/polyamine antiporter
VARRAISTPSASPIRTAPRRLSRILGLGFGIAVIFGGTVGVGILRLPGEIAGKLGSTKLILLVWAIGGVYSLLGANALSEMGAALPQAGGFYVYSRRAFGPAAGFAMGWADWLNNCAGLAYVVVTAAEYLLLLLPFSPAHRLLVATGTALGLLAFFGVMQWFGLRLSSSIQKFTSTVTGVTFLALVIACLLHSKHSVVASAPGIVTPGAGIFALLVPVFAVIPAIVVAYDGWYEAIYFTEEDTNAAKHLPRAMIGGVVLITSLYLLMNLAFLHVLTVPQLAASKLAAADAAQMVFPAWSGTFVTVLSLLTLLSFINAVLLGAPRILFAVGRDGLFRGAAQVSPGGTPRVALLVTAAIVALFILSGKFDEIVGVAAILMAITYSVNYSAVFVLRFREPGMTRPFRAWGYPVTTALVLLGSLIFLVGDVQQDRLSAVRAAVLLALALPVYWWRGRNLNLGRLKER